MEPGPNKEMLLLQLNQLMEQAAGDAETMELYKQKLAELDASRRANAQLEAALDAERGRANTAERQLATVAEDAEGATKMLGDQLRAALRDKAALERQLESTSENLETARDQLARARQDREDATLEGDRLREDLGNMTARAVSAEDAGSEASKKTSVIYVRAKRKLRRVATVFLGGVAAGRDVDNSESAARTKIRRPPKY